MARARSGELDPRWAERLGPALTAGETQHRLGVASPSTVAKLVSDGRLLALPTESGDVVFPCFQFDESGHPWPELETILNAFGGAAETPYTIAAWFVSPQELLGGATPAGRLRDGGGNEDVIAAARSAAAQLRQ